MISVYSVLFTLVLFSEWSRHPVSSAVPEGKLDDERTEPDVVASLLDEGMTDPIRVAPVYRRTLFLDNRHDDSNPKIILLTDSGLRGHRRRGPSSALTHSLAPLTEPSSEHSPAEYTLSVERREADLDLLRCMIGRVYRPCYDAAKA